LLLDGLRLCISKCAGQVSSPEAHPCSGRRCSKCRTQSFAKDQVHFQGPLRKAITPSNSLDPRTSNFAAGNLITLAFLRRLYVDRSRSLQELGADQRSPELWLGEGVFRPSQPWKISLSPCCTKFERHLVESCSTEPPSSAGMETCRVKAVMSRWSLSWRGISVQQGSTAKIGAKLCGAAALEPKCCEGRQAYGRVRDGVWELELGLQAKAKAAYDGATLART
jgi:hypothetical protein